MRRHSTRLSQTELDFMADPITEPTDTAMTNSNGKASKAKAAKKTKQSKKQSARPKTSKSKKDKVASEKGSTRTRHARPYPVVAFNQATTIGDGIHKIAAGEKVRRLTLLKQLNLSPGSSSTQMLITNSGKYKITIGSYAADYLEFTENGKIACDPNAKPAVKLKARFALAINGVEAFKVLYDEYHGKKLVARGVMEDRLKETELKIDDMNECIDIFITNVKELGLLQTIGGSEHLISIEQALEELGETPEVQVHSQVKTPGDTGKSVTSSKTEWDSICFYVTPIGSPDSEKRKHSDFFKNSLIEPAMKELGLKVVRADEVENPGMISTTIIEHLKRSKLVIADLSMANPNVYYEIGLRHACRKPIVQIRQKKEDIPFDVGQVNTITIDNTDFYSFFPQMNTFIAEIAAMARAALDDPERVSNPITVFYPQFWD
jgi:hypothetical protein